MEETNPIDTIIKNRYIEEIVNNIGVQTDLKDDLIQDIYVILLEYDQEKLKELINKNQIKFFISRIITNQYCSCTSPFFKQYRKPLINKFKTIEELIEDEDKEE